MSKEPLIIDRLPLFKPVKDKVGTMEAIFEGPDEGWQGRIFQVKLLTYKDGSMDIHRQTGSQFEEHLIEAEKVLLARDLMLDPTDKWMVGCTGAYRSVIKKVY